MKALGKCFCCRRRRHVRVEGVALGVTGITDRPPPAHFRPTPARHSLCTHRQAFMSLCELSRVITITSGYRKVHDNLLRSWGWCGAESSSRLPIDICAQLR